MLSWVWITKFKAKQFQLQFNQLNFFHKKYLMRFQVRQSKDAIKHSQHHHSVILDQKTSAVHNCRRHSARVSQQRIYHHIPMRNSTVSNVQRQSTINQRKKSWNFRSHSSHSAIVKEFSFRTNQFQLCSDLFAKEFNHNSKRNDEDAIVRVFDAIFSYFLLSNCGNIIRQEKNTFK